jgi:hypothetical protein
LSPLLVEFLAAGDALLTRRVKAKSGRHAVVVRFSRSRRPLGGLEQAKAISLASFSP